jgi:hypothetical protein
MAGECPKGSGPAGTVIKKAGKGSMESLFLFLFDMYRQYATILIGTFYC